MAHQDLRSQVQKYGSHRPSVWPFLLCLLVLLLGAVRAAVCSSCRLGPLSRTCSSRCFFADSLIASMAPVFHMFEGRPACRGISGGFLRSLLPATTYARFCQRPRTLFPRARQIFNGIATTFTRWAVYGNADRARHHGFLCRKTRHGRFGSSNS